jgi:hypothetical protein
LKLLVWQTPNWPFNCKVNGFVRAQMAESVIDLLVSLKQTDKAIHHGVPRIKSTVKTPALLRDLREA